MTISLAVGSWLVPVTITLLLVVVFVGLVLVENERSGGNSWLPSAPTSVVFLVIGSVVVGFGWLIWGLTVLFQKILL
jgi:hypothetical protein